MIQSLREYAKDHTATELKNRYQLNSITVETKEVENDDSMEAKKIKSWEEGFVTNATFDRASGNFTFMKVLSVSPPRAKTLNEARGYIIADYQDHLEKQWVEDLRKVYQVKVNQKVLDTLVK
jgi:peptidyl-prolyl cis-trans isomerase SurA